MYRIVLTALLVFSGLFLLPAQIFAQQSDTALVRKHLHYLTKVTFPRNYNHLAVMDSAADYIHLVFKNYSDHTEVMEFEAKGRKYQIVSCSFDTVHKRRLIIGAHYDVCKDQEGADDNASGVVGLLELARMLRGKDLGCRIDIVAYPLEEPPFFMTEQMGSYVHAKYCFDNKLDIIGMVCLEMIGYFSDEKGSQTYPVKFLKLFYGSRGNYILVARKTGTGAFGRRIRKGMDKTCMMPVKSFIAPELVGGLDLSDHRNYWKFGYKAVMITNSAFYRNTAYHTVNDTMERLDIQRMSDVINGVFVAVTRIK